MTNIKNFSNPKQNIPKSKAGLVVMLCLLSVFVGVTLAFFFADNFASKTIGMSGAVNIEAVGAAPAHNSIEDTISTTKLEINLEDNYDVLIPGMKISIPANCKVYRSSTKPLLRAMLNVTMYENDLITESTDLTISSSIFTQLVTIVEGNGWYLHTDGYYYYVGSIDQDEDTLLGESLIQEVDATLGHKVIPFINADIEFPKTIDSTYSGKGVKITIIFQGIQNYIPDNKGDQLPNTINNSQKIFSTFTASVPPASLDLFTITTNNGELVLDIKDVNELPEVLVLPSEDAEGNEITTLGTTFSGNCGDVEKLVVPSTYTTISSEAFKASTIENVDLSQTSITELPANCFQDSSITSITLPSTLRTLDVNCLNGTNLVSLVIPEGVVEIKSQAIWHSYYLQTIYIPSTVEIIDEVFVYGSNITKIIVSEDNPYFYDVDDSMLIGVDGRFYKGVATLPSTFVIPDNVYKLNTYSLTLSPNIETINLNNVTTIGTSALPQYLKSFVIPDYNTAFYTSVGYDLIQKSNNNLVKLCPQDTKFDYYIPDTVVRLMAYCMDKCNIGTLTFGKNCRWMDVYALDKTDFFAIHPENTYWTINANGTALFQDNQLMRYSSTCADTAYTVPNNITSLYFEAFGFNENLVTINLPNGLTTITSNVFEGCTNLKNVNIPSTVTSLRTNVFRNSGIEELTLYGTLADNCLDNAQKLKHVTMMNSVTSIGSQVFQSCKALEWIEFKSATPPTFANSNMFTGASSNWVIYVPDSAVATYKAVPQLQPWADRIKPVSERT